MKEILGAFTRDQLQHAVVIYEWLRLQGKTMEDLAKYIKFEIQEVIVLREERILRGKIAQMFIPKCEDCEAYLRLGPGDEDHGVWDCRRCGWSKLTERPFREELQLFRLKVEEKFNGLSDAEKRDILSKS